jgi:hypothetical protein
VNPGDTRCRAAATIAMADNASYLLSSEDYDIPEPRTFYHGNASSSGNSYKCFTFEEEDFLFLQVLFINIFVANAFISPFHHTNNAY